MHGKDRKHEITFKDKISNIRELGEQDIIFDVAGTNRSYWMMALAKAKLKFGFPHKSFLKGTLYNVTVPRSDFQAEVEVMLDMLRLLGHVPPSRLDFAYPDNQDVCDKENPYILYFNGCSQPRRVLKQEQMYALVESAIQRFPDKKHIYLDGLKDDEKGDYLKPLTSHDNFDIQPCLPLDELIKFSAGASAVVSVDTGVLNVGVSTNTPTVGVFYSTNPYRVMPRFVPFHHIAMNPDGSVPSNEQLLALLDKALQYSSRS